MTIFHSNHFLVSTTAKAEECPRCHRGIWIALVNGFETKVEPTPLNLLEEVQMRLSNPRVRIFQTYGTTFELQHRTAWHIAKADSRVKVLPEHDCKRNDPGIIINFFKTETSEKGEF